MQYTYRIPYSEEDEKSQAYTDIRWDIERMTHIVITKNCDTMITVGNVEEVDGVRYKHFTITTPRDLNDTEKAWLDSHMEKKELWGTLGYPKSLSVDIDPVTIAAFLDEKTKGAAFFRGFHGNKINIGLERELTDEEYADCVARFGDTLRLSNG